MKTNFPILALLVVACVGSSLAKKSAIAQQPEKFDGTWWLSAPADQRSGFINGASDCLVWAAHDLRFNATPEQLSKGVSRYYSQHPEDKNASVFQVWENLVSKEKSELPERDGEKWTKSHWYLDGLWWRGSTREEQLGFVQGYMLCMKDRVPSPRDSYSQKAEGYRHRIDEFYQQHSEADSKAVSEVLRTFRDRKPNPQRTSVTK